jgi:hypothetical protein
LRNGGALEKHGLYLLAEGAHVPFFDAAHLGVELPLQFFLEGDDFDKMRLTQLS